VEGDLCARRQELFCADPGHVLRSYAVGLWSGTVRNGSVLFDPHLMPYGILRSMRNACCSSAASIVSLLSANHDCPECTRLLGACGLVSASTDSSPAPVRGIALCRLDHLHPRSSDRSHCKPSRMGPDPGSFRLWCRQLIRIGRHDGNVMWTTISPGPHYISDHRRW
jgi:hypothetical protein